MASFFWKQHDTAPKIITQLKDSAGNVPDLTGASVKFIMKAADGSGNPVGPTPKINAVGTIVTPATAGQVAYQPITGDTDTAGNFVAEWEVTFSSGNKQTYPDPGYDTVTITADLDGV